MKGKIKQSLLSFDYVLAAAVIGMSVFGVFMIYAATNAGAIPALIVSRFGRLYIEQRLYVATGIFLLLFFSFVDYHIYTRFYWVIFGLCLLLLILVLYIGYDPATRTARWIRIPIPGRTGGMSIQPSEFAKIFMIVFLAKFIDARKETFNHILNLLFILACVALPVVLIFMQPSLSASMVIIAIALIILFTGGLYYRTIITGAALIIPAGLAVWLDTRRSDPLFMDKLFPYQWQRIETYLRPEIGSDEYRQVHDSLVAIGTGGFSGKGFGNNSYIINGHNDFIFSVVAEQFGFVGCAVLLGAMALVIAKCILTALRAGDLQGRLIAAGIAGMLLFETFVNVGVTTGILPNTGIAFPYLSSGGSIMWVHMIAIGMVINIGMPRKKPMFQSDENGRGIK